MRTLRIGRPGRSAGGQLESFHGPANEIKAIKAYTKVYYTVNPSKKSISKKGHLHLYMFLIHGLVPSYLSHIVIRISGLSSIRISLVSHQMEIISTAEATFQISPGKGGNAKL